MIRTCLLLAALMGVAAMPAGANPHDAHQPSGLTLTPAYAFPLPTPGSYRLPPIKAAAGGTLLDEAGQPRELGGLLDGRITIVGFVYTRCADVCPAASLDMARLQDRVARVGAGSSRLRLITISFDPDHDTPAVMREYASALRSTDPAAPEWLFLTAADRASLAPLLAAYDQRVGRKPLPDGSPNALSHLFRGFLVDPAGKIRNIYSLDFFDPELVFTDIRSLEAERH